ncbi:glycoside hydrolase family 127 protein [Flavisolibacter sp. BT320]|nr:glycoside hydrolase family 127 protein [Flavisolibacter longurius]
MRLRYIHIPLLIILSVFTMTLKAQVANIPLFANSTPIREAFQPLPTGAVKPAGWLQVQLRQNLDGFTGHLDSLVPDLILKDDIYGKNRLTRQLKSKDVGALGEEGAWQAQFLWWNSETQSNWRDGYLRTAILLNDKKHLQRARDYVNRILATQDRDGYLGIYDKDLRYSFKNENGELWSKATLLRGLLAWYEHTKERQVLTSIIRAVENVMANYSKDRSQPFFSANPNAGGLTHGLAFTDVLEKLYRITKNKAYLDYLVFLYRDFSSHPLNEDGQFAKLLNSGLPLKGHGVHTYEHLRSVAAAYYASGDKGLQTALQNFLQKIENTTTVSGAPIGDEFIGGRMADAATGYEYCSLHELLDSYSSLLAKTGNAVYGDKIETLFFNAAQGARHPTESAICYLKTDNAYVLTGGRNGDSSDKFQTRYRYSPVHKEAAVCCVPNAGRITPSYVQNAWMVQQDTLVAVLFGPSKLETTIGGQQITIRQDTRYPYENNIRFHIQAAKQKPFFLKIRKPAWASQVKSSETYTVRDGYLLFQFSRSPTHPLTLQFEAQVQVKNDRAGDYYFSYGPLVLAHPITGTQTVTRQYTVAGLQESIYTPDNLTIYRFAEGEIKKDESQELVFYTQLYNPKTAKNEPVTLVPMGTTILLQVTFRK